MDRREIGMEKTPEERYNERLKRIEDAIALKVPDRVPFFPMTHYFAATYTGMRGEEAFYDSDKWFAANKKMNIELAPDAYFPVLMSVYPGRGLEALNCKQIKWPGHGVPSSSTYQFVEGEYLKEDEYDAFLDDPTDFLIRRYMPRVFGSLEPLQTLPPIKDLFMQGYKGSLTCAFLANPEIAKAFESLYRAGLEAKKQLAGDAVFHKDMVEQGFPLGIGTSIYVPFDHISDMLRGMRGVMIDMYRQPDKLLEAMDKIYFPTLFKAGVERAKRTGCLKVFIPLHRGSDGFMSIEQFETFYWPGFKKVVLGLIDEGLTPCMFFEGDYTKRLEYLTELPKGKTVGFFDATDMSKAKEVVGGTMCIGGNMPVSLLKTGTPDQVKDYSKKLIDVAGKGGGFIMSANTVIDDANPELVKIWGDFTKEYGVYA
jgi:hypothetical protein